MPRKRKTCTATGGSSRAPSKIPDGDEGVDLVHEDKTKKLDVILQDFDVEMKTRIEMVEEFCNNMVRVVERKLNVELLHIPPKVQKMKISDFLAQGGVWNNSKEDVEIDNFASQVNEKFNTKLALQPIEEEANSENSDKTKRRKVNKCSRRAVLAKKQPMGPPPTTSRTRRTRVVTGKQFVTPTHGHIAGNVGSWDTPLITPKFSSKLPCTPATGLRCMNRGERVTLVSNASGSPVSTSESTLLVRVGDQMVMIGESDMDNDTKLIIERVKQKLRVLATDGGV